MTNVSSEGKSSIKNKLVTPLSSVSSSATTVPNYSRRSLTMNEIKIIRQKPVIYLLLSALGITAQQKSGVAEPHKKWFEDENGRFKWSFGCSFPSAKLVSVGGYFAVDVNKMKNNQSSTCPRLCYEDRRCTHFIYSNGYCDMKMFKLVDASPKAAIYNNPGGLCGFVVKRPDVVKNWQVGGSKKGNGRTRWSTNCDYPNVNFNIYSGIKFMFDRSQCGDHCLSIKSCSHFVWVNSFCYVKDFRGAPIVQILDKVIPLCGFIPERQAAVITQRGNSRTTVPSKGNSPSKLTAFLSTVSSITNKQKNTVSVIAQPKTGTSKTKKATSG